MERYYRFAGVELAVGFPEKQMPQEERTLAPFRVERVDDPHRFIFEMVDALEAPLGDCIAVRPDLRVYRSESVRLRFIGSVREDWTGAYIRVENNGKENRVQLKKNRFSYTVGIKTVLNAIEAEHLIARAGGFVFHSSYIEWQGKAILFTAPSGSGKSTQADLWHKLRGAEIINGDRSAVRCADGNIIAEGIPFAGSSNFCKNRILPLAAVVYLSQTPTTSIRKLRGFEAFSRIWEGVSVNVWDKEDMMLVSDVVKQVAETVPVFYLACTPDESAVVALEKMLRE